MSKIRYIPDYTIRIYAAIEYNSVAVFLYRILNFIMQHIYHHDLPVDDRGYYGRFGGAYIPEILHSNVELLKEAYYKAVDDPEFINRFNLLLHDYVGPRRSTKPAD